MPEYQISCSHCLNNLSFPDSMLNTTVKCPACGNHLELTTPPAILQKNEEPSLPPCEEPPKLRSRNAETESAPQIEKDGNALPERMKANKLIAGRICSICNAEIELGQDVCNCQECFTSMHAACHAKRNGCGNPSCPSYKSKLSIPKKDFAGNSDAASDDQIPCRFCGEMINKNAKLCKHCGEFQNEADRKAFNKNNVDDDSTLSWSEIVFGIICSGIGCIVGIVYLCQGKKKGWKLIGISLLASLFWSVIKGILASLQQ